MMHLSLYINEGGSKQSCMEQNNPSIGTSDES